MRHRIIPVLLLKNNGLYKGKKFKDHKYVGDPINAVKIFNDKEVDELVFMDITASLDNKEPNYTMLHDIASECFMPLAYGGGITSAEMIRQILMVGIEKVIINTQAVRNPEFVKRSVNYFGSSTIVVSIDAKKNLFGKYNVYIRCPEGRSKQGRSTYCTFTCCACSSKYSGWGKGSQGRKNEQNEKDHSRQTGFCQEQYCYANNFQ